MNSNKSGKVEDTRSLGIYVIPFVLNTFCADIFNQRIFNEFRKTHWNGDLYRRRTKPNLCLENNYFRFNKKKHVGKLKNNEIFFSNLKIRRMLIIGPPGEKI